MYLCNIHHHTVTFFLVTSTFNIYHLSNSQICNTILLTMGFPGDTVVKNPPADAGGRREQVWFLGWENSPGVGNGNRLQYFGQENSMDREAWEATLRGVAKSQTQLSARARTDTDTDTHTHTHTHTLLTIVTILCIVCVSSSVISDSLRPHTL